MKKIAWITLFTTVLVWSAISPADYLTWLLEAAPAIIGFIVLAITAKRFPLTPLSYTLILAHCIILMVGAHYTYAEVPLFDLIRDWLAQDRNNYDKLGHFVQGFVPAIICREILLRKQVFRSHAWQNFFIVCFCLAFSAFYELIEWWVALAAGISAEAFLGTQGDPWDTQSDMALALIGAVLSLVTLTNYHDKQLAALASKKPIEA